jgi:hypothetical protein
VCVAFALALVPSSASGARRGACTWGASSIQAHLVNGRIVETAPVTTGCSG